MRKKRLSVIMLVLFCFRPLFPLDMTDWTDTLSGIFDDTFIDEHEGTTVFRSLTIPSGGRPESLGTAYTGIADDISFFDYNPAASAVMERTEAAVFHNAWIADSAMETLAGTIRTGNLGLGAQFKCFYVPFTEYNLYGERVAGSYYSETSVTLNAAYQFFAGYTFKGIAVGANLRGSWRSVPDYTDNETDEIIAGSGLEQSALAVMADVGILLRFNAAKFYSDREPNLRIGLSAQNIGVALTGFGSQNGIGLDDALPTRISAGISYKPFAPLLVSAEFRKPVSLQHFSTSGTWSAAVGAEITVTSFFAFDAGFLLQGANPRISIGSGFAVRSVQMHVAYTFDLTSSVNPINHLSLSAKLRLSDRGRSERQQQIDDLYTRGLQCYAEGDFAGALLLWKAVLELDKGFDPAADGISAIERSESLYQHIVDIQTLD